VNSERDTLWNAQIDQVTLAAVAQQRADHNLDHSWLIGFAAARRVGAEVPAC